MPLPEGGPKVPWPPKHCEPVNRQLAIWSAWYSGQAEQLAAIYAGDGATGTGTDTTGFFGSETGGWKAAAKRVVDTVRRWFWGTRSASTQQRSRLHVPLAGDIAAASADLLFSEPPTFTLPQVAEAAEAEGKKAEDPTQARLDDILDDGAHATLLEAAEICAALGGVYLRVVWDQTVATKPWLSAVHPDAAVPEWRWGRLWSVIFWKVIAQDGKTVVRHLECHDRGLISHGVYIGTEDELGTPAPLTAYEATAGLVTAEYPDGRIDTGAQQLTAAYVPNMRPNRIWRNSPAAAYYGRSDYSGVEPLMDALDMVESSWMRDVDLGKARLVVPAEYMQSNGPGAGASIDLDREVYEPIGAMADETGKTVQIEQVQFAIRVEEHERTVDALKTTIVENAGYSAQTFGLAADGAAVTATEIAAKNRRSLITRDRKANYWRPELTDLAFTLLEVDRHIFHTPITPARPLVEWPDAVSIDPLTQAQTLRELHTAEAISIEEKVRTLHPDWDGPKVKAEVDRIRTDYARDVTNPDTFNGDLGGGQGEQ
jgi:hypothetical protein